MRRCVSSPRTDRAAALAAVTQIDAVFDGLPDVAPAGAAPVAPAAVPRAARSQ